MKFIILTEHYTQDCMYLNPSSIERMMVIHLSEKTSATQITLSTTTFTVIETPKQIIDLINNRSTIPIRRQDLINDQVYFKEDISLALDEDLRKKSIQSHNPNRRTHE